MSEHGPRNCRGSFQCLGGALLCLVLAGCAVKQPQKAFLPQPQLARALAGYKTNPRTPVVKAVVAPPARTNNLVLHWEVAFRKVDATHWKIPISTSLESSNDLVHWQQITNFPVQIGPFPADGFTVAVPARDEHHKFFRVNDHYQ